MPDNLMTGTLTNIVNFIAAAGGLGTAAFGLVDATKAIGGGMSNPGFGFVRAAVEPFLSDATNDAGAPAAFGKSQVIATLRANWLNGVAKADQKAIAKSLIRLGITPDDARRLARAAGVNPDHLEQVATRIYEGSPLTQQDLNTLGRFDAIVSATLDLGYERADQFYRNSAKIVAGCFAVVLSAIGGGLIFHSHKVTGGLSDYLASHEFVLSLLVGAISTPLAPVAKDLSTSLTAAVTAVVAAKR